MECAEWRVEFCTAAAVRKLGSPVQGELSAKPTEGLYRRPVIAFTPNNIRTYLTESEAKTNV